MVISNQTSRPKEKGIVNFAIGAGMWGLDREGFLDRSRDCRYVSTEATFNWLATNTSAQVMKKIKNLKNC